jgi:uncharacterized protein (DUF1800 family)
LFLLFLIESGNFPFSAGKFMAKINFCRKLSLTFLLLFCFGLTVFAETDPNPDSPVPILLNASDATRVLAVEAKNWNGNLPRKSPGAFLPDRDTIITLFVTNLDLLPDEGANAFRVYLANQNNKIYELETLELSQVTKTVYALKIRLYESSNYRAQPPANGDALIYLTWRGLVSNVLKIGLGKTGGDITIPEIPKLTAAYSAESSDFVGYLYSGDRIRFLEQAAFGPTTPLDSRIRRIGLRTWLAEQFETPYPTIPYPNIPLMPSTPSSTCTLTSDHVCYRTHYTQVPLQQWFFKEALYGNAQLRHRVTWALSQIMVTSGVTIQQSSHMIAYHKTLSKNAFENYRKLLSEITLNPAIGDYLDVVRSTKNNPNENYAREVLQLFSIGLVMLNQDGTPQLDGQGNTIPTYNQNTINNFSKVFTGWTYCASGCENSAPGLLNYKDPLILNPNNHDTTEKNLLNYPNAVSQTINACTNCKTAQQTTEYAIDSLNKAIDNIFYHPNTAPYISKLLIQHLVTSDPSPAYVGRVAAIFNNNGQNIRGDLKSVVKAILLDPEARGNLKTAPRYGKLREPVQLLTNLGRIFPAKSWNGSQLSDGGLSTFCDKMGQNPFYSPTVFNYFPPDYIVPGTTILAPEFNILNTGTGVNRINNLYFLVFEGLAPNATDAFFGTSLDVSEVVPYAQADQTGNQLLDFLNTKMLHGAMSLAHRTSILSAVTAVPADNPLLRARTAIYLIAASSQYQVQR